MMATPRMSLVPEEWRGVEPIPTPSGDQEMAVLLALDLEPEEAKTMPISMADWNVPHEPAGGRRLAKPKKRKDQRAESRRGPG